MTAGAIGSIGSIAGAAAANIGSLANFAVGVGAGVASAIGTIGSAAASGLWNMGGLTVNALGNTMKVPIQGFYNTMEGILNTLGGIASEIGHQGIVNWVLYSVGGICANTLGAFAGLLSPSQSRAISVGASWGGTIPGPPDPWTVVGKSWDYTGNPLDAWKFRSSP